MQHANLEEGDGRALRHQPGDQRPQRGGGVQDIVEEVELEDAEGSALCVREAGDEAERGDGGQHKGEAQGDLSHAVHRRLIPCNETD